MSRRTVAVIGPGEGASHAEEVAARQLGRGLAERGAIVITGGLGGVMGAAAAGVKEVGGLSVGLLPGSDRLEGSPAHTVLLPTGLGELRNGLVVRAAETVVAIGGSWGTLSEIALALRTDVPLVHLNGWELPLAGGEQVESVADALAAVERLLAR